LLEELEVRPKIMSMVLGHSTGSVTFDTYTHITPKQLATVGERVNERYLLKSPGRARTSPKTCPEARRFGPPTPLSRHCGLIGLWSDRFWPRWMTFCRSWMPLGYMRAT